MDDTITLHTLRAPVGSSHRKKRVGRGQGSGLGKTAGRGGKGQKARSGNMRFEGFEGGQSPLQRRMPKFGFTSPRRVRFALVNLDALTATFLAGATVDEAALRESGLVKGRWQGIKVLGTGTMKHAVTVKAHKFSASAKSAIVGAGGSVVELPMRVHPPEKPTRKQAKA